MIPKIIHYCWFGKAEKPLSVEKCISSWKKFCPNYQIIEWNESNFNVNFNSFTQKAYQAKKYAFVSDVARLYALVTQGGIYMDTDVEMLKGIDDFIKSNGGITCFQSESNAVSTGLLICEKGFPLFKEFLSSYDHRHFQQEGTYSMIPNTALLTNLCVSYGLKLNNCTQTIKGLTVLPREYFSPKNPITKEIKITENTYVIHYFDSSWTSEIKECKEKLHRKYPFLSSKVRNFLAYKKVKGLRAAVMATKRYFKEKKNSKVKP